jgi:hypothetical protein
MRKVIHKEPTKTSEFQFQVKEEKRLKVSILMNSVHYLLSRVFIFKEKGQYRLIVFNQGKLLTDAKYKTAKGARIAFLKLWWYRKERENVMPKWTHFYTPEKNWFETWYPCAIKRRFVSRLINRILYFIETVFIMTVNDGYQLIVIHRGKVLTNEIYKTVEEARREFLNQYNHKAWRKGVKPNWSQFYPPDTKWLHKNLELLDKAHLLCRSASGFLC